jgi:hypothetical protein
MLDALQGETSKVLTSAELGVARQTLVIRVSSSAEADVEDVGASQLRMMHESSGRVPGNSNAAVVPAEICLFSGGADDDLFLADLSGEIQMRIGIKRNPEHYLERMLDFTSGRVSPPQRFMLHHSSGRAEHSARLEREEASNEVTMDMLRFTSGRKSSSPPLSEGDSP